jgi:hypothetical protein
MLDKFSFWSSKTTLRGANLVYRVRIEAFDDGPGTPFVPVYDPDIFIALRKAGANMAVLSMPGPFSASPPYEADPDAVRLLDYLVGAAAIAGLFVVIAYRTGPGRNDKDLLDFLPGPLERDLHQPGHPSQLAFTGMWLFVANRLKDQACVAGYDLLVEPHTRTDVDDDEDLFRAGWQQLCEQTITAIRAVDADTPILVQPSSWASPDVLGVWQMPAGSKLVCSVHQYEPFNYTNDVDGAGQNLFDFSLTRTAYQHIDDFKSKFPDIPVAVTEFGVKHSCTKCDDFLQQQPNVLEASGCNHAIWVWGDDSDNFDVRDPSLLPIISTNWEKNTTFYS